MNSPEVCVLKTDGINCDMEMGYAFEAAGGNQAIVHVNELRSGLRKLSDFGILAIPGGFSYGDDIASGKVLANELTSYLSDQIFDFVDSGRPVIGICNGFQVLVRTGLLPYRAADIEQVQTATLTDNNIGRFDCRWIELSVEKSVCRFVQPEDFGEVSIPMQVAHGEGRFLTSQQELDDLEGNEMVVFRYTDSPYVAQPYNPNGSMNDIAGICDPKGLILGMMPHPERSVNSFHPYRKRTEVARNAANIIFSNIVNYAKEF